MEKKGGWLAMKVERFIKQIIRTKPCYKELAETGRIIKSRVIEQNVVHADENGLRVAGKLHWLHTAITTLINGQKEETLERLISEKDAVLAFAFN